MLVWVFFGEHIMSYIFGLYRNYEIQHIGKPNEVGIETAPCERKLAFIELLVDCIIFGGSIYHLTTNTKAQIHDQPFVNYWIIIDMTIMLFTLPYVNFAKYLTLDGEITKNVYTVYKI